mmetsp:Transcript_49354/g.152203  ORF Transcript_49354/g.152203 Transcript_49354/m.152203 type:complete len:132 (+) Transcript_49354:94-489(+)
MEVVRVGVEPRGECPLGAPLRVGLTFEAKRDLKAASWQLRYVADLVHARHVIPLSTTDSADYAAGSHCAEVAAPDGIPARSLPSALLENLGMLELALTEASGPEVAVVRLVTDVRRRGGSELLRVVLDPLH